MSESAPAFEYGPAVRKQTPLLIGIVGPSGTGKTVSALRLAHGVRRVTGGRVALVDTEGRRGLHYADQFGFDFDHLNFAAPFGPARYLAAIDHAAAKGARVIVVDSFSHEWEGEGGVLDLHEAELDRLAGTDWNKRQAVNLLGWKKPKAEHQALVNGILQRDVSLVFCFRAKEKLKIERGKDPEKRGYQVIGDERFRFELTVSFFLHPGADGVPSWKSEHRDEQANMKIPVQFREILKEPKQLSEDIGERLARWAAGDAPAKPDGTPVRNLLDDFAACHDRGTFDALEGRRAKVWPNLAGADQKRLRTARDAAEKRLAQPREDDGVNEPPPRGELFDASGGVPH